MMARPLSELMHQALDQDPMIQAVTADSRKAGPGVLFAALPGTKVDGASFIPAAIAAGAAAILAGPEVPDQSVPVIRVSDPRRAYALAAQALYQRQPRVCVAVTGTNGKTSVATFCRQIFEALGHKAASMGTLGVTAIGQQLTPPGLTRRMQPMSPR